ncbi:MAG: AraC family transcriptional regulator [Acidiphilium sp. 37-64-53]|uniref:GlxA family transcriptional regulator n=1 Tax=Acidiphilium TaxID=522 RepID=UPI000BCBF133|nr:MULTISPECIES: GlxA family transcriptional regulator [Acidiphilium]OYW02306.1 MAG: AraC family transcriptional regulator [Acidiphilium sp. 37-64-53]OZB29242.1 MAG: AraC family transcriptional regulator [Acidiphilium sp. 34-64-41]HQT85460.1 GlxA family transcriptional regulator [Acidiphilium rubrum]
MNIARLAHFGFLTLPDYSMIAVTSAIEALRMANRCAGRSIYSWTVYGLNDTPVAASNCMTMAPTAALDQPSRAAPPDLLFVCGGVDVRSVVGRPLLTALRRAARDGVPLGALCTGTFALAEAGLLDGYRCAVHWEDAASMRDAFPAIELVNELFVLDRNRLTCTGGIGPLDMMLYLIEAKLGRVVAEHVAVTFILDRIRTSGERQPIAAQDRARSDQPTLARAMTMIEDQINEPPKLTDIAARLGISLRQLQRLFRAHLGESPASFIKALRLQRAQAMLQAREMPVTEVAMACGFGSSAYFASAYRAHFGYSPRAERQLRAIAAVSRSAMRLS